MSYTPAPTSHLPPLRLPVLIGTMTCLSVGIGILMFVLKCQSSQGFHVNIHPQTRYVSVGGWSAATVDARKALGTKPSRQSSTFASTHQRRRNSCVQLVDGTLATSIGVVIAGIGVVAVGRGLSALVSAFNLADYRTATGHDIRLTDQRLQSQCRRNVHPLTGRILPGPAAGPNIPDSTSSETALEGPSAPDTVCEARVMDWREEIRQASDLPEVGTDDAGGGVGWVKGGDINCREK